MKTKMDIETLYLYSETQGEGIIASLFGSLNFAEVGEMINSHYLPTLTIEDSQVIYKRNRENNYKTFLNN